MNRDELKVLCDKITEDLAKQGKILEGGWQVFQLISLPVDAPDIQKAEMRKAFFLGADHLFCSMLSILDPGSEPTEKDMERMDLIYKELMKFRKEEQAGS